MTHLLTHDTCLTPGDARFDAPPFTPEGPDHIHGPCLPLSRRPSPEPWTPGPCTITQVEGELMQAGGRAKGKWQREKMRGKPEREFEMKHEGWQVKTEDKKEKNTKRGKEKIKTGNIARLEN